MPARTCGGDALDLFAREDADKLALLAQHRESGNSIGGKNRLGGG